MNELLKNLLLLSAAGSALGVVLILARRLCGGRLPNTLWYYAWLPVLLRLVLPLPGLIPGAAAERVTAPLSAVTESAGPCAYRYADAATNLIVSGGAEEAETAEPAAAVRVETVSTGERAASASQPQLELLESPGLEVMKTPALWLGIWLAGAVVFFALYTAGYFRFRRALLRTLQTTDGQTARIYASLADVRKPCLLSSAFVKTPMLLGLVRPLIILPVGSFSPAAARNILRHELTHYRRGDLYVKWFFVLTASMHWFNPLMHIFRRELDRVCELSCDENVLARMEPSERRSYGETLLDLAANRALPAGVVATTFATEKRALKERLVHIMKFNWKPRAIIALTVAALVLIGAVALAAAPAREASGSIEPTPGASAGSAEGSAEQQTVNVSTVDEFLAAIGSDVNIVLAPGTYDLSTAAGYGNTDTQEIRPYYWEEVFDGYELVIENVANLSITTSADDPSAAVLAAVPRYADVLAFMDCENITLTGFTMGHTKEQGSCAGGVVHLMGTDSVTVDNCALYGCGVLGVQAENCRNILVSGSDIYECSDGAVELTSCRNVQFDNCSFRDCYNRYGDTPSAAFWMFNIGSCYGVAITDSHVYGNFSREFVHVDYSKEVYLLGTLFEDNTVDNEYDWYSSTILSVEGNPVVVAGCEFRDDFPIFDDGEETVAADMDGSALSYDELAAMKQAHVDFPGFEAPAEIVLDKTLNENGMYEVHVSTVDEFLAAIEPNTVIYLDADLFDLTSASDYGAYGGSYYYWDEMYDGPGLVIAGVENLSIVGAGKNATRIESLPRYADVIRFDDCQRVVVSGVTAGHTLGAGQCAGAVLEFRGCDGVVVNNCGLFGCGTYGVTAWESTDITLKGNEIYECSYGAVSLSECMGVAIEESDIHDCAYPTYQVYDSLRIIIDGKSLEEKDISSLDPDLVGFLEQEALEGDYPILSEILARGYAVFEENIDVPGAGPYKSAVS